MKRKKRPQWLKQLRRDIAYGLVRITVLLFRAIPRWLAIWIGSAAGRIAVRLASGERRLARKQLGMAFNGEKTPAELDRISGDIFRNLVLNYIDTIRLKAMSADEIRSVVVPHNMEQVHEVISRGPAILLTSHTGCWELLGAYLSIEGIPIDVITRKLYDDRLERLLLDTRQSSGLGNISRGGNTRDIIRSLNAGRGVGILIDQDIPVKGAFVEFFGIPAHTAIAPAQLALKRGIPILPILTYRDERHRHHACIGEPLHIDSTGDTERDIEALTARCSDVTEAFIREHPEQWVWFHKRWKTRPPEEKA